MMRFGLGYPIPIHEIQKNADYRPRQSAFSESDQIYVVAVRTRLTFVLGGPNASLSLLGIPPHSLRVKQLAFRIPTI